MRTFLRGINHKAMRLIVSLTRCCLYLRKDHTSYIVLLFKYCVTPRDEANQTVEIRRTYPSLSYYSLLAVTGVELSQALVKVAQVNGLL